MQQCDNEGCCLGLPAARNGTESKLEQCFAFADKQICCGDEAQVDSLQATVRDQEIALASSSYALETAEVQYHSMQESLRCAEAAAGVAASECDALVRIVRNLIDQESRVRSTQAHRAHALREALQQTHAALRRAADKDRGAQDDVRAQQRA